MTKEEAIRRLFNIERCTPIHTREDVRVFEALEMAIKALEQEPNKEAYNQGYEDGYLAGQKNIAERFEGLIKSGISTDTPDDIEYVIGLLNELSSANPEDPETEIEELDFVQEHKKIPVTLQVQKYCDRNICVSNEYNGIGCDECEVTKSQELKTDYIAHGTDGNIYKLTISNGKEFEQEQKTGHWYIDERPESDRETICSNCEQSIFMYHKMDFDYRPKYCPNCGAKMVEPQENEEV